MKLIRLLALFLVLASLFTLVACVPEEEPTPEETTLADTTAEEETTPEEETTAAPDPANDGKLRVIIASDLHYTTLETYYSVSTDKRMQHFVDTLLLEHQSSPIDLLIIAGDISLDHLFKRGTWTAERVSTTKTFMEKYASQIRAAGIPIFALAGNHEQFNNEQWKQFTGNDRFGTIALEGNLFIMLDAFSVDLEPNYDYDPTYANHDVDYIKQQMEAHPECENVFLISHHFDYFNESLEFKQLIRSDSRIKGLFQGHSHLNDIIDMGSPYGNKKIYQTGNFSQLGPNATKEQITEYFWGFRELIITPDHAATRYIIPKTDIILNGVVFIQTTRRISKSATIY